jgi:Cyclic nucleotide-binding domain
MDLSSRFSRWRDPARRPLGGPRADGSNPVKLTVGGRLLRVHVEVERPGKSEGATAETIDEAPVPADEILADQPLGAPVYTHGPVAGPDYPRQSEHSDSPDLRPHSAATGFWDVLDPTEREVLRSLASWRTFAAGARIMEEGERADHVIVILGGQVEIRLHVDGNEQVVAVRGLGELVGERAALKVSVRSATVVARVMVWALVVQTKDFAAFMSAHPRVLDIVQNQQYQRRAAGAPGYEYDDNADWSPAGRVNRGHPEEGHSTGYSNKRPQTLAGENCTVILTDVADYGARIRTDNDRLLIREALFRMTQNAMQDFPSAQTEDRGDSFLTVIPPDASTARVLDQLTKELPGALERHNSAQGESARFKLRLAVNVGPVVSHMGGVSGEAIIVAARLVEAPSFKRALATSRASLGVIASPFVYETIVRHSYNPREVASYVQVPVEVKETSTTAWMRLFASPEPSPVVPYPGASGSHAGH